ncbi:transglutaminase-like cysteine peptidase [Methyloceanibacter sp.]|uniref:transglutaminase-like cysteine peptidase n=1 Tax=Methyloceanibacter sp. TaxID=1965321 RepID=UPI002D532F7A|nr:transglutaminase-like cysteine peptidase [Methyloceanibacter sp.]HZP10188.1 transglutaminase-like cysteine peptidase [Methyloceanibacter sp.]
MKQFVLGSAFLMFISSLPGDVTNDHSISVTPPKIEAQKVAFLQSFGDTLPPIGYVNFCREHQADCQPQPKFADRVQLTGAKFRELEQVNMQVNTSVQPMTDMELYHKVEYWTYPTKHKGDCEDYVLLKQRLLIERGWPESTLLITVVRDENKEGHAVLTVRTDKGDFVLDNKRNEILRFADTPYTYIKRQSERNPLVWISLLPPETAPQTQVSASNSH